MSKKILVSLSYKLDKQIRYNKIITQFKKKGYEIKRFNYRDEFFKPDMLVSFIEDIKGKNKNIERISLISNIKDIIFSSYRCYNSLIDDFVYFISNRNGNKLLLFDSNDVKRDFYRELSNFTGTENETLQGKIYLNLDFDKYQPLFIFMKSNYNSSYFDSLSNFNFKQKVNKKKVNKVYYYKGSSFKFQSDGQAVTEKVVLKKELNNKINLDLTKIQEISRYNYIYNIILEIYKMQDKKIADEFLLSYFDSLKKINLRKQEEICNSIIESIKDKKKSFSHIADLLSLLLRLKVDRFKIFKKFISEKGFSCELVPNKANYMELNIFYQIVCTYLKMKDFEKCRKLCEGHLKNYEFDFKILEIYAKCLNKLNLKDKLRNVCHKLLSLDSNNNIALRFIDKYSLEIKNQSKLDKEVIVLLKGKSRYNVARYFIDNLSQIYNKLGYKTKIIDSSSDDTDDLFNILLTNKVKFVLAVNGKVIKYFTEELAYFPNINFVSKYADHPVYHYNRLLSPLENETILCVDKTHKKFIKEVLNLDSIFVPAGAHINFDNNIVEKDNDILFAGTIKDPEFFRTEWLKFGGLISEIFDELAEYALSKEFLDIQNDVDYILKCKGIDLKRNHKKDIYKCARLVDKYARNYRRIKVLNALKGFNVKVFGSGWHKFIENKKGYSINNSIDFEKLIEEIKKSKILINVIPEFSYNGHERIFNGMYYGTAVVTNTNEYLRNNFKDNEDIIYYKWKEIDQLPNILNKLLDNEDKLKKITRNGQKKVAKSHTFLHRAKEILSYIE
ncbi:glycosyltransferase family protein [Orenia marismortui]|uniref:glycosyltransferase family protein n=1 Tax=Orenia marismortui TaxID=46469 RepID=UPI0003606640|nr:glycosyltransferase [Orenia marismortui]